MNDFGAIAKAKRQELGLTQREVGNRACCDKNTVKAFENNTRSVRLDCVLSIYKVLGMTLEVKDEQT